MTTVTTLFNNLDLAKDGVQDGFGGFGRAPRAAKDAKTARLESVKC